MEFRYTVVHDNIVREEKFASKSSHNFPFWWVGRYPADQGGESIIETLLGKTKIIAKTDQDFDCLDIQISNKNKIPVEIRKKIQDFLDSLLEDI